MYVPDDLYSYKINKKFEFNDILNLNMRVKKKRCTDTKLQTMLC